MPPSFERKNGKALGYPRPQMVDQEMIDRARRNYMAMATSAKEAHVPLAFITYSLSTSAFGAANRAILEAAAESGALVIRSLYAILRIPREKRRFGWAAHPNAAMYREIARDVSQVVLATVPPRALQVETEEAR